MDRVVVHCQRDGLFDRQNRSTRRVSRLRVRDVREDRRDGRAKRRRDELAELHRGILLSGVWLSYGSLDFWVSGAQTASALSRRGARHVLPIVGAPEL